MKRPNKSPTGFPTDPQQWEPPRGIYYEMNAQRPNAPFMMRWKDSDRPRSQSFADAKDREKAARALADKREDHGKEILNFDPREWRRWIEFKELSDGADPLEVLREWQAMRAAAGLTAKGSTTLRDAIEQYLAHRRTERLSEDTHRHFKKHLTERFLAQHATLRLPALTTDMISQWLANLIHPRTGKPMDAVTKRHHRKDVNTFLSWCINRGWLARNPCEAVPVPLVEEQDVALLTVEEGRRLFAANAGHRVIHRIAFEAFGFLRSSSAGRMTKASVNFQDRGLRMPGSLHKSGKAKFRQGHPANLWAWLDSAPDATWEMTPIQYRNEKHDAFVRAGVGGSENRLRKTCLSAHLAWQRNHPLTSYLAQHRHSSTTEIYLGVMTESDGRAWFEIVP